jgi:hypothetical protein
MPEEKDPPSSGNGPEEDSTQPRPTVIGSSPPTAAEAAGSGLKPTTIAGSAKMTSGEAEAARIKPTVIGSGLGSPNAATPNRQPTVIPATPTAPSDPKSAAGAARPSVMPTTMPAGIPAPDPVQPSVNQPPATTPPRPTTFQPTTPAGRPTPVVSQPTSVPGFARKRLPVTVDDLRRLSPATKFRILEKAVQRLQHFVVEDASDRSAVLWGHETQKKYSDVMATSLKLSQSSALQQANRHIQRMTEILGSIDIPAVCGISRNNAFVSRFLGNMTRRIDTPDELESAQRELNQIVAIMTNSLDELFSLKESIEQVSQQISKTGEEAEILMVAGLYLAEYLKADPTRSKLADRFTDRCLSLAQTIAQLRSGDTLRQSQIEHPLRVISTIQHVSLVMMPAWLGSIASILGMLETTRRPNPTEVGNIEKEMQVILDRLTK